MANATVIQGWARSRRGEVESGITEMQSGVAVFEASGARAPTFLLARLAEAYLNAGLIGEAGRLIELPLETANQTDQRTHEAELY